MDTAVPEALTRPQLCAACGASGVLSLEVTPCKDCAGCTEENPSCFRRICNPCSFFGCQVRCSSELSLASPWLLWVISYSTVVSRPCKPTGWFYLHRRPGGIKQQAGTAKQAGRPLNPTEWGGKPKLTPPSKPSDTQVSSTAKQHGHLPGKNGGSIGKHLDLNWLAVQSGIWVPPAFVQAERDGVSLDNFPPACFEYQMESFSWRAGTVPNFTGAFFLPTSAVFVTT